MNDYERTGFVLSVFSLEETYLQTDCEDLEIHGFWLEFYFPFTCNRTTDKKTET